MAAYLIGQIQVHDEDLWKQYVEGVAASMVSIDARILFRGEKQGDLAGTNPRDRAVVIEFANANELDRWFNSESYQKLIPLRDRAADVVITHYR
ncbi:hypothetical protein RE428_44850 [Marinobacter nanhaiticus D15-8W]|uniref:DUF1330 domain-containing protein n=1 Tax=Marinobacter nanhaiticus D15-8W TaxID=626887 RepID=N6WVU6_9GAMM|nr:DUF1330 domain-containing protein [Marinobacter nanhaiticus]ENO15681.1 DUF1330 domain-containing protein [Marinobacter nanhaiticus D15-8W]BES73467.1 hypothetical protein RE428_44850 [Marinobacter nanhaiticus D15-8W]